MKYEYYLKYILKRIKSGRYIKIEVDFSKMFFELIKIVILSIKLLFIRIKDIIKLNINELLLGGVL